jgi:hypothetical protein
MKVNEHTNVQMPLKTVVSLITLVSVGTWAYFGVIERLNNIETQGKLMLSDVEKNTEFRIKWPRGEMGSLPSDSQQDLLIEFISSQLEHLTAEMEGMMSNSVNIKRAQTDIEKMLQDIEKLKDKVRQNGSN